VLTRKSVIKNNIKIYVILFLMNGQDWEPVVWKKEETVKAIVKDKEQAPRVMTVSIQNAIKQGRLNIKMSQKDLAQKLNVDVSIVIDYENGKAIPTNSFISKIERALNTTLPRAPKKEKVFDDN
jgi:ribosome-binding protein aMBF1 (putative translation factor)